jgi:hypothetical protein
VERKVKVKIMVKKRKGSGTAVSIYLPADVKHLHDLAIQDPNLVPSEIYRNALQSILGDREVKHPLELMKESQEAEVKELSEMLLQASKRLESTTARLPNELAKSNWLRHNLGETQLAEMEHLRIVLFFDSSHPKAIGRGLEKINFSSDVNESLLRYKTLISKYEATKLGPEMTKDFQLIDDRHPPELKQGYVRCVNADDMSIDCCISIKDIDGTATTIESDRGIELGDDLQYRCTSCWTARRNEHKGFKKVGWSQTVDIPRLKPYWKTEALTENQQKIMPKVEKGIGTLQVIANQSLKIQLEKSKARAEEIYHLECVEDASRIEELIDLASAPYLKDEFGEEIPAYQGHKRWSVHRTRGRKELMKSKYPDLYDEFHALKLELSNLKNKKKEFIKSKTDELVSIFVQKQNEEMLTPPKKEARDALNEVV